MRINAIACGLVAWMASVSTVGGADDRGANPRPAGLDRRIPWTTSKVVGSPEPAPPYRAELLFPKLEPTKTLSFDRVPGTRDYLIFEQIGTGATASSSRANLLRISADADGSRPETVLELPGLGFGLDFHPDFARNGFLFIGWNLRVDGEYRSRVSRFTVAREPPHRIDPASELAIIEWASNGHNGCDVAFGADGMLYASSGDGTSDSDPDLRGQDLGHLTSKILRIDVDHPEPGRPYAVPADNPFVDLPGARPETWAYGLRNPWRLSFDGPTGQLWAGNNGQDLWEQAFLIQKGANYGWSVTEGSHPFQLGRKLGPTPLTPPTVEHHHAEARSLTGGVVYHGDRLPDLEGAYVYGDYATGKIWAVRHDGTRILWHREIADTTLQITGFGLDADGNLVVVDHLTGPHRLVPSPESADAPAFPTRLSETGLFRSVRDRTPEPGLIAYSVNAPLWSDGAAKERLMAIPGDGKIGFKTGGTGWDFPEGTVLVKTFLLDLASAGSDAPRPIETRLMTRQQGEWVGYSYAWDDDLADARLVEKEGRDQTFKVRDPAAPGRTRDQTWRYPSRAECMVCHSRQANFVLGPSEVQMNRDHDYGGGRVANQLATLEQIGLFHAPLPARPEALTRLVDPYDPGADLDQRARSYLHANCANCHVKAGGGNAAIDLSIRTKPDRMGVFDVPPLHDALGLTDPRIVAPGHPDRSTLYLRTSRRGPGQMPPIATSVIDQAAVNLLRDWIEDVHPPATTARSD